jgi:hypothetical protein
VRFKCSNYDLGLPLPLVFAVVFGRRTGKVWRWLVLVGCAVCAAPAAAWSPGTAQAEAASGFVVDTADRRDVLAFYHTIYQASEGYAGRINWTGDVTTGVAGTTGEAFQIDVLRRVNFYRALVGVRAGVIFDAGKG